MPPKKQDGAKGKDVGNPAEQLQATSSSPHNEMASENTSKQIAAMLQTFLHNQQLREERLEKEAQCCEHKYRTLQHQFIQLQSEVHQDRQERLSKGPVSDAFTATDFCSNCHGRPPTQKDMATSAGAGAAASQEQPYVLSTFNRLRMMTWASDEDIEHYLTTFECIAQAYKWPRQHWVLHLLPLLTGKARVAYVTMEPNNSLFLTSDTG
ncbi:hypothetical protein QQF64_006347 [Cirrhinus molitorella]|uniref:Uncharacterized protein n=1 Tax=Cirrhinus molitorella TaxID=172907 RepID=A0ABR3MEU3_9TELE